MLIKRKVSFKSDYYKPNWYYRLKWKFFPPKLSLEIKLDDKKRHTLSEMIDMDKPIKRGKEKNNMFFILDKETCDFKSSMSSNTPFLINTSNFLKMKID